MQGDALNSESTKTAGVVLQTAFKTTSTKSNGLGQLALEGGIAGLLSVSRPDTLRSQRDGPGSFGLAASIQADETTSSHLEVMQPSVK